MLDADEAKLTRTGTITIRDGEIYVDGFSGQGTSCRDVVALACVWAIGKLQEELLATLQAPGGGIAAIGSPEPPDVAELTTTIHDLIDHGDHMADILRRTAVALRGPEPEGKHWGWSDLPERAAAAREDGKSLDWLEADALTPGGLLLHDGTVSGKRGLAFGDRLMRDLREAIETARQMRAELQNFEINRLDAQPVHAADPGATEGKRWGG